MALLLGLLLNQDKNQGKNQVETFDDIWWRFMFGFPIIVSVIQIVFLMTIFRHESPMILKE